jgi:hypothetical protein
MYPDWVENPFLHSEQKKGFLPDAGLASDCGGTSSKPVRFSEIVGSRSLDNLNELFDGSKVVGGGEKADTEFF